MKTKSIGNLFELAEKQIITEINQGKRKIKRYNININGKKLIRPYRFSDLLNYAIILRKQLDKYGKSGFLQKVKNIKTGRVIELNTKKELRHLRYLNERNKKLDK